MNAWALQMNAACLCRHLLQFCLQRNTSAAATELQNVSKNHAPPCCLTLLQGTLQWRWDILTGSSTVLSESHQAKPALFLSSTLPPILRMFRFLGQSDMPAIINLQISAKWNCIGNAHYSAGGEVDYPGKVSPYIKPAYNEPKFSLLHVPPFPI